ncbi:MAG: imidazole glycerol phosphate synthase subunit HisF [Alphaproteobacteria bacterium]|nr:imidazole glycerol phosphate synthase subunit HisF [Alphaproteobacteria bacterium]
MQLLCAASEESPGEEGLGLIDGTVRRLPAGVSVPHLGWTVVQPAGEGPLSAGEACFAHSFALRDAPPGWQVAWSEHGAPFVAAAWRGRVLACQFHPELSGTWGAGLLARWLDGSAAAAAAVPTRHGPSARIVPCLDVRDGRVVKGIRFQGLRDAGDPVAQAARYAAQGADELVLLDVSATPDGRATAAETVAAVRAVLDVPLTVGGGIRQVADAERLLRAGADKVGVNSAAVARPALLGELSDRFGAQCVVLALDAARRQDGDGWEVVVRSGKERTGIDAIAWAQQAEQLGAGEILLTSWDRDGTGEGYDLPLLAAIRAAVSVPVIASGGAAGPGHLSDALDAGADAVLAASIFHDGHTTVGAVKAALASRHPMRIPRETS